MGICTYCHLPYRSLKRPQTMCGYCRRKTVTCECGQVRLRKNTTDNQCLQCIKSAPQCLLCKKRFRKTFQNNICHNCSRTNTPLIFPNKTTYLNNQQYKLITHPLTQHASLLACAGSGKTTTIVSKIAYMITKEGIDPETIMLTTFTRNAAKEMKERLTTLLGYEAPLLCGTFHSLSYRLLQKYEPEILTNALYHIDEIQHLFNQYLQNKDKKANEITSKIKYLFVDEYQDINDVQFSIIQAFTNKNTILTAVGDDGQNIYTFRGSNIRYILNFPTLFPNSKQYHLTKNYRSTKEIIKVANQAIRRNKNTIPKQMLSNYKTPSNKPIIYHFSHMYKEVNWICTQIETLINSKQAKADEIAVLTRNGSPLFYVEEELAKQEINSLLIMGKVRQEMRPDHVTLSTVHSSKGLEWKYVYLMGASDLFFPADKLQLEEERRLFYVAVTRCKQYLTISYSKEKPSLTRFVTELHPTLFTFNDPSTTYKETDNSDHTPSNSVTSLIDSLSGEDYLELRKRNILPNFSFTTETVHNSHQYSSFIDQKNIYAEFGIFVDYLLRRMTGDYVDQKAEKIIKSVPLSNADQQEYTLHFKSIAHLTALELTNLGNKLDKMWMKRISWKMQRFGIPTVADVVITSRFYLPFPFVKRMEYAYLAYQDPKQKWYNILEEIYDVSKTHSISFNRRAVLYKRVSRYELKRHLSMYQEMNSFIKGKAKKATRIVTTPPFSTEKISGEGDLLLDDLLIDFKVHQGSALEINHVLQLLTYVALSRELGYDIKRIALYNPLMGQYHETDISEWDKGEELINFLLK